MKLGLPTTASFLSLLRRMQGTGYSNDEDSVRIAELDGVAEVAARSCESLDAAVNNSFVSSAEESLDEYDRLLSLPTDATLTSSQRRARLVAWKRALPKLIEARLDSALDRWLGTTSGVTLTPDSLQAVTQGSSRLAALAISRIEPGATIATMRVVDAITRRGLPARAAVCKGATRYADYGQPVERAAFRAANFEPNLSADNVPIAPLEQYPGSVMTDEIYTEIQAQLLWKPFRGGTGTTTNHFTLDHASLGACVYAEGSVAALSQIAIEDSGTADGGAWDERVTQAWIVIHTSAFTDSTTLVDIGWLAPSKLGSVGIFVDQHPFIGTATVANLGLTLVSNALQLVNNHATQTYHFKLFVRRTPRYHRDTLHDREPWATTRTFVGYVATAIMAESRVRNPTTSTYAKLVAPGSAVRRILYTGAMQRASGGDTPNIVTLDTSIDWRNRALLVTHLWEGSTVVKEASSTPLTPAMIADPTGTPTGASLTRVFLTGPGAVANSAAVGAYQMYCTDMWIWADSTTGFLKAEMKSAVSANAYGVGFVMVTATPVLGTPAVALPTFPVNASQACPADFTLPQNYGCYAQGQSGASAVVTAPPLGTIVDGNLPARPVSWLVRERKGYSYDRLVDVRQRIFGQRRRLVSLSVLAGATVEIDAFSTVPEGSTGTLDQMDYRDRFVSIEGLWSASDISLGKTLPISDQPACHFAATMYTGPYGDRSVSIPGSSFDLVISFVFGRNGDDAFQSRLVLTNNDPFTRYVNLAIECTGFLGLTDRRLDGAVA